MNLFKSEFLFLLFHTLIMVMLFVLAAIDVSFPSLSQLKYYGIV